MGKFSLGGRVLSRGNLIESSKPEVISTGTDTTDFIRNHIESKVRLYAIGNSDRRLRDVAVDLINASGMDWVDIADGCYLSKSTIANLAKDKTQHPQTETLERVFRFFGMCVRMNPELIISKYQNVSKRKTKQKRGSK